MRLPTPSRLAASLCLAFALLLALAAAGWAYGQAAASVRAPPLPQRTDYVGSNTCKSCHARHHESWGRTYHRTMTQEASRKSVQGDFSGAVVSAWGVSVRPRQGEDGRYYFDYLKPDGGLAQSVELQRTVGSHRYQQYLAKDGDGRYARMHLIWHNGEQRWVHYNSAFLYDDHQGFNEHAALWNPNCIFCHNTGVKPGITNADELNARVARGENFHFLNAAHWQSEVAELGIACEACHGPGGTHSALNRNPLRRLALRLNEGRDGSIVNPKRLPTQRASEVCGQCHAQRLPAREGEVQEWLKTGPSFRPGDALDDHVRLVQRDTPGSAEKPDLFKQRFWDDGTPRLSAYEWTSLKQSACAKEASCLSCHGGHTGEPAGMITAANREGASCSGCHAEAAAQPFHQRHAKASQGTNCVDCHMAKSIYGVMEVHRSHRIRSPEPQAAADQSRPDACTGCHTDASAAWAAASITALASGQPAPARDAQVLPENLRQLFAGDTVARAVAAKLAGHPRAALTPEARAAQLPLLLAAMDDDYPGIRRFAWQSATSSAELLGLPALSKQLAAFDYQTLGRARDPVLASIRAALPAPAPGARWGGLLDASGQADAAVIEALRAQAAKTPISIGE